MDGTALVAQFIADTRWEHLPPAVQRKARLTLLDALGAALASCGAHHRRICGADLARRPGDHLGERPAGIR